MSSQATVPIPPGATIGAPPTAWDASGRPVTDSRTVSIPPGATIGNQVTAWDAQGNPVSGSGDVFARLAAEDQARRNASSQNSKDIFDQLAANGGQIPDSYPDTSGQITNDIGKTVIFPKEGESFEDTMNRAIKYGQSVTQQDINDEVKTSPKKLAETIAAAPLIGAAGAAAINVPATEASGLVAGGRAALQAIGGIPGLLKSAWDWASANPVKAYILYKVLSEAGIGPSGIKKVMHIASGAGE